MSPKTITVTFKINYRCEHGQALFVIGNVPQLGDWKIQNAFRLSWNEGHEWSGTVEFDRGQDPLRFNYKYIVAAHDRLDSKYAIWEQGLNRCFLAKSKQNHLVMDRWGYQKVEIFVKTFFPKEDLDSKALGIAGKLVQYEQKDSLTEMGLCRKRKSTTSQIWKFGLWVSIAIEEISFSLYLIDVLHGVIKNRRVERFYLLNPDNLVLNLQKGLRVRKNVIIAAEELHLSHFVFTQINERIFLGSCLNESKEKKFLFTEKVGAILSLETPNDRARVPREDELWQLQNIKPDPENSIPEFRYPIEDSAFDVMEKAIKAAKFLKQLVEIYKRVYIHCTFGVARSVHVVIAYLCLYEGMGFEEAINRVTNARRQARPNEAEVIRRRSLKKSLLEGLN